MVLCSQRLVDILVCDALLVRLPSKRGALNSDCIGSKRISLSNMKLISKWKYILINQS